MSLRKEPLFTKLIVSVTHEQVYHGDVETMLCKIWEKYWTASGRQNVHKLFKKYYVCKIAPGKTLKTALFRCII